MTWLDLGRLRYTWVDLGRLSVTNTLAYFSISLITAVKSFMLQALDQVSKSGATSWGVSFQGEI
jgi:hypothetical protein